MSKISKQMNKYIGLTENISSRLEELTRYKSCSYETLLEAERYG